MISFFCTGCTVPLGEKTENPPKKDQYYGLQFNEYIVTDERKVNIRYLIHYKNC